MTALGSDVDVTISEVGLRDGLQSLASIMPTEAKKTWIDMQAKAGVPELEVGSFVPKKLLPQLADTGELVAHALTHEDLSVAALVPNLRGAEAATAAGATRMTLPFSVSESHSLANLRRSHDEIFAEVEQIVGHLASIPESKRPGFEVGLSTAFGCTIEGRVSEDDVVRSAERLVALGADEVGLSDTSGYADPAAVKRLTKKIWNAVGRERMHGIHLHNTRGQGLANALAALDVGLDTIDSSLGGIGGCPFAPGASGNIVTEDLVFMLEAMGVRTGIDLDALLEVRRFVQEALPSEQLYGFVCEAGLPKGFRDA
ncbi:MAG: hydroxymethylglutaryl-CoA lyase [Gammaproteobacteria bacterium]|nr:hydroxymethylglutaryl-CoA lyase [Gammaproteobacteria bacterium]MCY4324205.1 hydroxymethylglutaryl-CoA lyase [Gammaproteobacteria bacterium]